MPEEKTVTLTVSWRGYDLVKHGGPPAEVNGGELLLIDPGHFNALVKACVRAGRLPYENDEAWVLGCG